MNKNKSVSLFQILESSLPSDHCKQVAGDYYITNSTIQDETNILDVGCGVGNSYDLFKKQNPTVNWTGIDLVVSPEVRLRNRKDCNFVGFDGETLPFNNGTFDLVFSKQVFEHVYRPEKLLKEINRVLKNGGIFIGSVSYLEPYHSLSITNFTPYGLKKMLNDNNLNLVELRPGIDSITLLVRSMIQSKFGVDYFLTHESPINFLIGIFYKILGKDIKSTNFAKIAYAGHLIFFAKKT